MAKALINNEPLRECFKQLEAKEEISLAEVAMRCNWMAKDSKSGKSKPDSSRVARSLGLVAENGLHRSGLSYDNAVTLCRALHLEFTDVGI